MNSLEQMNTPGSAGQTVDTVGKNSVARSWKTEERHTTTKQQVSRTRLVDATSQGISHFGSGILSRLQKVKRISEGKYVATCPCHNDKTPSLAVTLKPDGVTLIHCFGCGASGLDICNALGISPAALFPPSNNPRYEKQNRQGFSAWQLLHVLERDLLVVLIAVNRNLIGGEQLCQSDVDYLKGVCVRINKALQYLEGKRND